MDETLGYWLVCGFVVFFVALMCGIMLEDKNNSQAGTDDDHELNRGSEHTSD